MRKIRNFLVFYLKKYGLLYFLNFIAGIFAGFLGIHPFSLKGFVVLFLCVGLSCLYLRIKHRKSLYLIINS